jgi:hypothetical protein
MGQILCIGACSVTMLCETCQLLILARIKCFKPRRPVLCEAFAAFLSWPLRRLEAREDRLASRL